MRYPALRIIVVVSYVTAAVVAVGVFAWVRWADHPTALAAAAAVLAFAAVVAQAEVLRVLMDIERNTRGLSLGGAAAPLAHTVEVGEPRDGLSRAELAILVAGGLLVMAVVIAVLV